MPGPIAVGALWAGAGVLLRWAGKKVVEHLPGIVMHVAVALGFYFAVAQPVTELGLEWVIGQFSGVTGTVAETLYYLNVDNYISAIFSAYSARSAVSAGSVVLKSRRTAGAGGA